MNLSREELWLIYAAMGNYKRHLQRLVGETVGDVNPAYFALVARLCQRFENEVNNEQDTL
jgi:hypothetical protein